MSGGRTELAVEDGRRVEVPALAEETVGGVEVEAASVEMGAASVETGLRMILNRCLLFSRTTVLRSSKSSCIFRYFGSAICRLRSIISILRDVLRGMALAFFHTNSATLA